MSDEELGCSDGKVWYIPHHGVYHPVTQKLRVVFDCGASYKGTSLNEQLLQGPDLTSSLVGVIIIQIQTFSGSSGGLVVTGHNIWLSTRWWFLA